MSPTIKGIVQTIDICVNDLGISRDYIINSIEEGLKKHKIGYVLYAIYSMIIEPSDRMMMEG